MKYYRRRSRRTLACGKYQQLKNRTLMLTHKRCRWQSPRALEPHSTTNITSAFLVCRKYLKHLKHASPEVNDKAMIVLVGSTAGKYGEAGRVDYAVTKCACDCSIVPIVYSWGWGGYPRSVLLVRTGGLTMTLNNEMVRLKDCAASDIRYSAWQRVTFNHMICASVFRRLTRMPLKKIALLIVTATHIMVQSSCIMSDLWSMVMSQAKY